jgi:hypothetical protein
MTDLKHSNKHNKFIPPDISGCWLNTNHYRLTQENPNVEASLADIKNIEDTYVKIKQKGEFVTYKIKSPTVFVAAPQNRIGVWKPILVNGKPLTWEVVLADYDDTNIIFLQVLETDDCGKPIKLWNNSVESFTSQNNPEQKMNVSRNILIRKN